MCENNQQLRFLTQVNVTGNKLKKLPKILCPALKNLVVDENEIESCELTAHPSIEFLSINKNKLVNLSGLENLPLLQSLSVSENENLASLDGISNCPNLTKLTLSGNPKLESLNNFPELPCLEELNLNGTQISKM